MNKDGKEPDSMYPQFSVTACKSLLLDYYHCTFFLPLVGLPKELHPKDELHYFYDADNNSQDDAQAWLYFSPAQRDILFQQQPIGETTEHPWPMEEWRLSISKTKSLRLLLGLNEHQKDPFSYQVVAFRSIRLYRYFNGIYILAFTVMPEFLMMLFEQREKQIYQWTLQCLGEEKSGIHDQKQWEKCKNKAIGWMEKHGEPLFRHDGAPATAWEAAENCCVGVHPRYQELQLEAWLRFTRLARQIYPTFAEQEKEGKICPQRLLENGVEVAVDFDQQSQLRIGQGANQAISNVLMYLLKQFFPEKQYPLLKYGLRELVCFDDDRMHVSTAYSLAKKDLPPEQLKRLFSLALFVDRITDTFSQEAMGGYAYTPFWIQSRAKRHSLGAWEGLGGYYGYTDYSSTVFYPNAYFRDIIAPRHVLPTYDRMLLQALFYAASLRLYDEQICKGTGKLINKVDWDALREQRKEFIRFTNQYWFHELTQQMQGKEIFSLQQEALGLKDHYEIIKDELERTDEFLQAEHEKTLAKRSHYLGLWGLAIALISVLPTINDAWKDGHTNNPGSLWYMLGSYFGWAGEWASAVAVIAVGGLLFAGIWLILWLLGRFR